MKETLLKDIELDIEQLKCLVNALDSNYNPILCEAAQRSVVQMKERLDTLLEELKREVSINPLLEDEVSLSEKDERESGNEFPIKKQMDLTDSFGNEKEKTIVDLVENNNPEKLAQYEESSTMNEALVEEEMKITLETLVIAEESNSTNEKVLEEPLQDGAAEIALEAVEEDKEETAFETENASLPTEEKRVSYKLEQGITTSNFIPVSDILITDLRQFITLNDTFRFTRELFDGDSSKMKETIDQLDQLDSFDEALTYMESLMTLDEEEEATQDFIDILKKRFNR